MKIEPEKPLYAYRPDILAPEVEPDAAPAVMTLHEAGRAMNAARLATKEARDALQAARADLQTARLALAQSIPAVSFQQNVRDFLEAQRLEKAARARGESWAIRATRKGRGSYLDTAASYARGADDPNSAARARNRYGYKRGAFGAERLGTPNFDPTRGNVPKVAKP